MVDGNIHRHFIHTSSWGLAHPARGPGETQFEMKKTPTPVGDISDSWGFGEPDEVAYAPCLRAGGFFLGRAFFTFGQVLIRPDAEGPALRGMT